MMMRPNVSSTSLTAAKKKKRNYRELERQKCAHCRAGPRGPRSATIAALHRPFVEAIRRRHKEDTSPGYSRKRLYCNSQGERGRNATAPALAAYYPSTKTRSLRPFAEALAECAASVRLIRFPRCFVLRLCLFGGGRNLLLKWAANRSKEYGVSGCF